MQIDVPAGEVLDRATILTIKLTRLPSAEGQAHAQRWLSALERAWHEAGHGAFADQPEWDGLLQTNLALWAVEDDLRAAEKREDFGPAFVADARAVYRLNDQRAALKRQVSERLNSTLVEQKSYGDP